MVIKEKKRSEIKEQYKWDLTKIYPNDQAWYEDFNRVQAMIPELQKGEGHIFDTAHGLLETLLIHEKVERAFVKLYMYAHLNNDEDTTNVAYQEIFGKIEQLETKLGEATSYLLPEILKQDWQEIEKQIKEVPELESFRFLLENVFRFKQHTLSEKEEKIVSALSSVLSNSDKAASFIRNADLKFGTILDEDGNEVALSNSNFIKYMTSKNREVRKNAFETLYHGYEGFKNTLACTYQGEVEKNNTLATLKHYPTARASALHDDNVDEAIYDRLVETVNANLSVMDEYYALKKKVLNVDELHLYDVYADLIGTFEKEYSFEEAKELVIKALSVLGDDYVKNLHRAFEEQWIDVMPSEGKRDGAYSYGCYDTNPYILLNYQGKIDDVATLAHELGHSMHSYYSYQKNTYKYGEYRIFVAEVASTVNELLLSDYLLKNTDCRDEKLFLLDDLMSKINATLFRQTMFAEFEQDMHQAAANGEVLTHAYLSDHYYDLVKKYFGKEVVVDDLIRYEWERIPHFYWKFYVFQYATGISAACYIASEILKGNQEVLNGYLTFLTLGGSQYPVDSLKVAGVDMNDPKVIESAISFFRDTISQFQTLYNEK